MNENEEVSQNSGLISSDKKLRGLAIVRGLIEMVIGTYFITGVAFLYLQGLSHSIDTWNLVYLIVSILFGVLLFSCGVLSFKKPAGFILLNRLAAITAIFLGLYYFLTSIFVSHWFIAGMSVLVIYMLIGASLLLLTSKLKRITEKNKEGEVPGT